MKRLPFLLCALVACGGTPDQKTTPTGGGTGSGGGKPAAAGDVTFDVGPIDVKGVVFEPEALGRPGMPLVEAKKKVTIEKQRTVFTSTKDPVQKEAQAAILATLLYQKSKDDKANEKALWTEARQALRDAATISKDKVDEITLRLLGSYELLLEDYPAAEKAWSALVNKAPKDKDAAYNRAWWAYSLLQQAKNADALAVVKDESVSAKQPELAYVTAWAKWRAGDDAGAWTAIVAAAEGWDKQSPSYDALVRDVYLFAGRANVSLAEITPKMYALFGAKQPRQQFEVLAKLGLQSYQYAGRWADAVAAIDAAFKIGGATVLPNETPVLRFQQADFTVRLDDPVASAAFAEQAIKALPTCGAKCSEKDKQDIVLGAFGMGAVFHSLYATSNDVRYYQPAHDLYAATVTLIMDEGRRNEAAKNQAILEATLKSTKAGTGTHDKTRIGPYLERHNQEVQACYEAALAANPKLGGRLTVTLESDQTGAIKGVTSDPKAGLADIAAVAGCATEHAKAWKLPKRGSAGNTRITLTYALSPRK